MSIIPASRKVYVPFLVLCRSSCASNVHGVRAAFLDARPPPAHPLLPHSTRFSPLFAFLTNPLSKTRPYTPQIPILYNPIPIRIAPPTRIYPCVFLRPKGSPPFWGCNEPIQATGQSTHNLKFLQSQIPYFMRVIGWVQSNAPEARISPCLKSHDASNRQRRFSRDHTP